MANKAPHPPSLEECEAALGPAREWAGRCFEIASQIVARGLSQGVAVYGHYIGQVHPRSHFGRLGRGAPFHRHGWILVPAPGKAPRDCDDLIVDPTRWAFTNEEPYIFFGFNLGEYDEGGNQTKRMMRGPRPEFTRAEPKEIQKLDPKAFGFAAFGFLLDFLGLVEAKDRRPREVTRNQLFWIANAPWGDLEPYTARIYEGFVASGLEAMIPVDNLLRARRQRAKLPRKPVRA